MHSSVATVNPASDTNKQTASFRTFRLGSAIIIKLRKFKTKKFNVVESTQLKLQTL